VASARQAEALGRALEAGRRAACGLARGAELAPELVSVDLAEALAALGEVDGRSAPEEVIEAVFSEFCVGK
jgi:tRNA modification GTPase